MNKTVSFDGARGVLVIIDQTLLPGREELICLTGIEEIRDAIKKLRVRGAPAIGAAAAIGLYLKAAELANGPAEPSGNEAFFNALHIAKERLNSARPTAVNLSWALNRMERAALENKNRSPADIAALLKAECVAILEEDERVCEEIGRRGLELLRPGMRILTHCNAGRLATVSVYGTATAPVYYGNERGYGFKVYCDETRPLLQGARLTAYELTAAGVDATLLCDNMAPSLMSAGLVDAVLVGCDRVAANGDVANKVGTSYVAIAAKHFGIPFYVCGPVSTFDFACESGKSIVIEQRDAAEVTDMWYSERLAPAGIKVFNPSFDVTPAGLITAFVTERGVIRPPYDKNLRMLTKS
jgi:methylthioribose-1-phosphate isomerase